MTRSIAAAALMAWTTSAGGPTPTRAQSATPPHFQSMAFLVGSCWMGTFPNSTITDEHCFEWIYDRQFIRDRHITRGGPPYEGETIYARLDTAAGVTYWYVNSKGGVSTGSMVDRGDYLYFPERHVTAKGVLEMRSVWRRSGPDSYRVVQEQKRGTVWDTAWTMELTRVQRSGPPTLGGLGARGPGNSPRGRNDRTSATGHALVARASLIPEE